MCAASGTKLFRASLVFFISYPPSNPLVPLSFPFIFFIFSLLSYLLFVGSI